MTDTIRKNIFNTRKFETTINGVRATAQNTESLPIKQQNYVYYDNYFGGNNCGLNAVMCANMLSIKYENASVIIGFRAHNGEEQARCPHLIACCKHKDGKEYIYDTSIGCLSNGKKIAVYNVFVKNEYIRYYKFKVYDVVKKLDRHLKISANLGQMKLKGMIHGDIDICYSKRPIFYKNIFKHDDIRIPENIALKQYLRIL